MLNSKTLGSLNVLGWVVSGFSVQTMCIYYCPLLVWRVMSLMQVLDRKATWLSVIVIVSRGGAFHYMMRAATAGSQCELLDVVLMFPYSERDNVEGSVPNKVNKERQRTKKWLNMDAFKAKVSIFEKSKSLTKLKTGLEQEYKGGSTNVHSLTDVPQVPSRQFFPKR